MREPRSLTATQVVEEALGEAQRLLGQKWLSTSPTTLIAIRDEAARGGPVLGLSLAVLLLTDALEAAGLADRTPDYLECEPRAGDDAPAPPGGRHLTPRQVAEATLGRRLGR